MPNTGEILALWMPTRFAPATVLFKMLAHVGEDTRQRIRLDREPADAVVLAPPAQLPACVATVGPGHGDRKLVPREPAAQMCEGFRIADAGQHRSRGRHARIERRARFLDQAALDLTPA